MKTDEESIKERKYNDEVVLLEGLFEFHPEAFRELSRDDLQALIDYYNLGSETNSIFKHRIRVIAEMPDIEEKAHAAARNLARKLGVDDLL